MTQNLVQADFTTRRRVLALLIKRIEVGTDQINIVYKVKPALLPTAPVEAVYNID